MKKLQVLLIFLCMTIGMITAQVTKVTGIVIDADSNEPIIGASVLVKGTTIGSITDVNGRYEITNIPKGSKTLTISFGKPIPWQTFDNRYTDSEWAMKLRNFSYNLPGNCEQEFDPEKNYTI